MAVLEQLNGWGAPHVAAAIVTTEGVVESFGDLDRPFRLASITKLFSAWATLVAIEEGSIALDTPAGQPGCTVRHLLSHAGGYPFDGRSPVSAPERTRIYSNTGIEIAADAVAAHTGMAFGDYLGAAVFEPLAMHAAVLRDSPAHGAWASVADLARFAGELLRPRLLAPETARAASTIQYPPLTGIVPGVGKFDPCPWGLGFEIKGGKSPHWISDALAPESFGHFGGSGTMLAVDPTRDIAVVALTDRPFDQWPDAVSSWRALTADIAEIYEAGGARR